MKQSLPSNEIHLYVTRPDQITDASLLKTYRNLLSNTEAERLQKIKFAHHQHQFLVTRALIRSSLSRYFDLPPKAWQFIKNQYGRPEVKAVPAMTPIRFNLSHTDGLILCGIVLQDDIGVDVEYMKRSNDLMAIAERYFSTTEIKQLKQTETENQPALFFEFWTLKEAYIKACGKGLSIPLNQFSFNLIEKNKVHIHFEPNNQDNPSHWHFWQINTSPPHKIAVAVKSTNQQPYQLIQSEVIPLC